MSAGQPAKKKGFLAVSLDLIRIQPGGTGSLAGRGFLLKLSLRFPSRRKSDFAALTF